MIYKQAAQILKKKYNAKLKQSKYKFFNDLSTNNQSSSKHLWKNINGLISNKDMEDHQTIQYIKVNNIKIEDNLTMCNEFNKFFISTVNKLADDFNFDDFVEYYDVNNNQNILTHTFSFKDTTTKDIIKLFPILCKKGPGHQGIPFKFIKIMPNIFSNLLCFYINQCISTSIFPSILKAGTVIPVYKKGEHSQIINYRPITICNNISKIFERILYNQILEHISKYNLLSPNQ